MIKNNKNLLKNALIFTLILLPIAVIAGVFTGFYTLDSYTPDMKALVLEQLGSESLFIAVVVIQCVAYSVICGFFGYIIADKVGLLKPFKFQKSPIIKALIFSAISSFALISLDYFAFARLIPVVAESYEGGITVQSFVNNFISSVTYGGIIEELMMRLFLMSLVSLIIWKIFFRKCDKENIPTGVFVASNIICAVFFAAGHLPATIVTFGEISAVILIRCFVMNGAAGILFGRLYRKYGIQYAMLAHIMFHVVMKLVVLLFI